MKRLDIAGKASHSRKRKIEKTEYSNIYKVTYTHPVTLDEIMSYAFRVSRQDFKNKSRQLWKQGYKTAKDAALALDIFLINRGDKPINILKKK